MVARRWEDHGPDGARHGEAGLLHPR